MKPDVSLGLLNVKFKKRVSPQKLTETSLRELRSLEIVCPRKSKELKIVTWIFKKLRNFQVKFSELKLSINLS